MLGVIGGSGLYSFEGLKVEEEIDIDTPFGKPSSPVVIGRIGEVRVAFLARHGRDHSFPPHLVPYRANLWALREVGVDRVLAVSAVGGIDKKLSSGDFFIPDSFLDFTKGRESTFYEGRFSKKGKGNDKVAELLNKGKVVHVDMTEPYCPEMRKLLSEILSRRGLPYKEGGVYACTEGPRFETTAEIRMLERLGASVVGMTGVPEVVLARELTMCYASLCVVANPAAGISGRKLTSEEVIEMMKKREDEIKEVISELVRILPEERSCGCWRILEGAEV